MAVSPDGAAGAATDTGLWIRGYHPARPGAPVLVCLPHAGGSASFFRPVSAALQPDIEVMAVQYPGRQDRRRERPLESIRSIADGVWGALAPRLTGPPVLFGHSMGAVVAFDVACLMERAGTPPAALVASGRRAPSLHGGEDVHLRPDDGIIAEIRRLSGTDDGILGDEEMLRAVLPALRADYTAVETYRAVPGQRLSCPVVAFVGDSDPRAPVAEAAAWSRHTTGPFESRVFPGGHFYLTEGPGEVIAGLRDIVSNRTSA